MNQNVQIKRVEIEKNQRIIAVSDVHGYWNYLEGVLKKLQYTSRDVLVIVGDAIEKGTESLKTARYILKLMAENPCVYVLNGNVDYDRVGLFLKEGKQAEADFLKALHWTRKVWKRGFFLDMLEEMQIALEDVNEENIGQIKAHMRAAYAKEIGLFTNLPTVLNIGNYLFVHAGVPTDDLEQLEKTDMFSCLKRDAFLKEDVAFSKNVVVGHWPVSLYSDDVDCLNPVYDYEKHIVAIDGGCALKNGAQLNALVIPNADADLHETTYVSYDDLPFLKAKKAQAASARTITVRFFDCRVELLEDCGDVMKVRHVSSGMEFWVPRTYLYGRDDNFFNCSDFSNVRLEVAEGDVLSVVEETSIGCIVKKDGVMGWYIP